MCGRAPYGEPWRRPQMVTGVEQYHLNLGKANAEGAKGPLMWCAAQRPRPYSHTHTHTHTNTHTHAHAHTHAHTHNHNHNHAHNHAHTHNHNHTHTPDHAPNQYCLWRPSLTPPESAQLWTLWFLPCNRARYFSTVGVFGRNGRSASYIPRAALGIPDLSPAQWQGVLNRMWCVRFVIFFS
eukprot:121879-Prorocentrum_minimum.AAC.2